MSQRTSHVLAGRGSTWRWALAAWVSPSASLGASRLTILGGCCGAAWRPTAWTAGSSRILHLLLAGNALRRPKVEQHNLAPQRRKRVLLPIQILQGKVGLGHICVVRRQDLARLGQQRILQARRNLRKSRKPGQLHVRQRWHTIFPRLLRSLGQRLGQRIRRRLKRLQPGLTRRGDLGKRSRELQLGSPRWKSADILRELKNHGRSLSIGDSLLLSVGRNPRHRRPGNEAKTLQLFIDGRLGRLTLQRRRSE